MTQGIRLRIILISMFLSACGTPFSSGQEEAQTMAEKYPPRVEDLRPTAGWAAEFRWG